jgi:hypothetical protein
MRTEVLNRLLSFPITSLPFVGQRFATEAVEGVEAEVRTVGSEFAKLKDAVPTRAELPAEAQRRTVELLRWAANSIEQISLSKPAAEAAETVEVAAQAEANPAV